MPFGRLSDYNVNLLLGTALSHWVRLSCPDLGSGCSCFIHRHILALQRHATNVLHLSLLPFCCCCCWLQVCCGPQGAQVLWLQAGRVL
jgi:hypothetical protein